MQNLFRHTKTPCHVYGIQRITVPQVLQYTDKITNAEKLLLGLAASLAFTCTIDRQFSTTAFLRALALQRNFASCKIHFASKSCFFLYWQCDCTALEQRPSAELCGVVQGMDSRNIRRGRHLYSAGRPSRWASAHIRVLSSSFFLRLISAVADWMSAIHAHMVWP